MRILKCNYYIVSLEYRAFRPSNFILGALVGDRMITARLTVPLPWLHERPQQIEHLQVARGSQATLSYLDDGITLAVDVVNPADDVAGLLDRPRPPAPGRVTLIAGDIPLPLRAELRRAQVSFIDVDGTAELFWPRLRISASRVTDEDLQRQTPPVTLRGAHARIVQALLGAWLDGHTITSGSELAARAQASEAAVSRTLRKLAEHGLVDLTLVGRAQRPEVVDPLALADILKSERGWPRTGTYHGYVYGRDAGGRLDEIMERERDHPWGGDIAVTGIVAAAQLGVLTTAAPPMLRLWLKCRPEGVPQALRHLGIEPVTVDEANVMVALDRNQVGTLERQPIGTPPIWTSHPIRVWCDLHSEPRGEDVAAQLWHAIT